MKLGYCGGSPQVRPSVIGVICATNAITARNLKWSAWGKPVSSAIGTAVVDLCAYTDCHTGRYGAVPIVVIASKIVTCGKRTHAYSDLQYVFVGRSPFRDIPGEHEVLEFLVRIAPAEPWRSVRSPDLLTSRITAGLTAGITTGITTGIIGGIMGG